MRPNRVKQKIERGERAYGVAVSWASPDLLEFLGYAGFEWVFIDAEHGAIGREACAELVRACYLSGLVPAVRIPDKSPSTILNYLETGVMGIIVPHTRTADEARAVVEAVRYQPLGKRGAGSSTRPANYGFTQTAQEYFAWANENIFIDINIEETEGVENLDEILAVDGVDVVGVGSGDLAMDMGYLGQKDHPEVDKVVQEAEAKIAASGKVLDAVVGDAAGVRNAEAIGARLIAVGVEGLLKTAIRTVLPS